MIVAGLQARFSSSRLPGKVLAPILGRPMLALQIERILRARRIDRLIVATSIRTDDDAIADLCREISVPCFRGALEDVLDRFHRAVAPLDPSHVVRLTGDCPLTDWTVIDRVIEAAVTSGADYASNTLTPSWPDGLDVEVMRFAALEQAWREARLPSEREHVTPFINKRPERFRLFDVRDERNLSDLRWTVDEPTDFELVRAIYEALYPGKADFTTADVLDLLARRPELMQFNLGIERNEGLKKSLAKDAEIER